MSELTANQSKRLTQLLMGLMGEINRRSAGDTLSLIHQNALTLTQMVALHCLRYDGARTLSGLGEQLRLSPSATSEMVQALVDRKMVSRVESPTDRRQKLVDVTEAGRSFVDHLASERATELERAVSDMDADFQEQMIRVLEQIVASLQKSRCSPGGAV